MKILVAHNYYQQPGGEDRVATAEARLLASYGHRIVRFEQSNLELSTIGPVGAIKKGIDSVWSKNSYRELKNLIAKEEPDIAHFHNTFPLISPSAYYACVESGIPVVQTLHNYRLLCPAATLMRDGQICELCLDQKFAWPAILHACYRQSFSQTAVSATMLAVHRAMRTWQTKVSVYIALSEFARKKFVQGGLPVDRLVVKPNFVHCDPGRRLERGEYALFIGRLSTEKGVHILLQAWRKLVQPIPLYIVGDGPMLEEVRAMINRFKASEIGLVGAVSPDGVTRWMKRARFLICPSIWFEGFPMTIAEAFSVGVPVLASRLGALEEIVQDGRTGLHVIPGDASDLARKVEWAWNHEQQLEQLGHEARAEFERKYAAEQSYVNLMAIYGKALDRNSEREHFTTAMPPPRAQQGLEPWKPTPYVSK